MRSAKRVAHEDADPLGLLPALAAKLKEAYSAQLRAFLRRYLLLTLAPAVRRRIFAAVTAQGRPLTLDFRITFRPPDASGFFRIDGELLTPLSELAAEAAADAPPDDPEYGPPFQGLFGQTVRARRPKGG